MISTHILDTTLGTPAANVEVFLEKENSGTWSLLSQQQTNNDGRAIFNIAAEAGNYRITFKTKDYFKRLGQKSFFNDAHVAFEIYDISRKYHIPLLLNPFSYSTYRGS